jgi:hypothetical protein
MKTGKITIDLEDEGIIIQVPKFTIRITSAISDQAQKSNFDAINTIKKEPTKRCLEEDEKTKTTSEDIQKLKNQEIVATMGVVKNEGDIQQSECASNLETLVAKDAIKTSEEISITENQKTIPASNDAENKETRDEAKNINAEGETEDKYGTMIDKYLTAEFNGEEHSSHEIVYEDVDEDDLVRTYINRRRKIANLYVDRPKISTIVHGKDILSCEDEELHEYYSREIPKFMQEGETEKNLQAVRANQGL